MRATAIAETDTQRGESPSAGRVYLYAVIDGPGATGAQPSGASGDGMGPVRVVTHGGLGCVVSTNTGEQLRAIPKEKLLRCLLRYQQVIEQFMTACTVLPVKFGTTVDSTEEVKALLQQGHGVLARALGSMRGKVEIEVAAMWDLNRALEAVRQERGVVRAWEAIAARGNPTYEDKVHLGKVVKACLDRRRESYRERMLNILQPIALDVAPNPLMSEEMVMNVAFLVERAQQPEFEGQARRLDQQLQDEITFRIIGPLPPYSFSSVEVTRLTAREMEEARCTLELAAPPSEAEVRKAYRRLAAQAQRKGEDAGARLLRLRRAATVLLASGQDASDGKGKTLFHITVRGGERQEVEAARFGGVLRV